MVHDPTRRWLWIALSVLAAPAGAAPLACPPNLAVAQHAADPPAGFQAFEIDKRHVWINAQLSDGPPDEQAWLAPDSTKKSPKAFTNTWTLYASPRGTWLSCVYGDTSVMLSRRLPEGLKVCEIRYDAGMSPPMATAIDCR